LQNNFNINDDLSSSDGESDGESVTLSIHGGAEPQPEEPQPAEPQPEQQPATPQPAARQSTRTKVPRKIFTL
jgi:hypothetical protein